MRGAMAMRWERVRWPREVGVKRVGDIVAVCSLWEVGDSGEAKEGSIE